jgi:hypothetical protein
MRWQTIDVGSFRDAVPDGFKLRIEPLPSETTQLVGDDYDRGSRGSIADSFFGTPKVTGGVEESLQSISVQQTPSIVLPVKANIKKALKIGIANGKTVFEIINEACKLHVGE